MMTTKSKPTTTAEALSAYLAAISNLADASRELAESRRRHRAAQKVCGLKLELLRKSTEATGQQEGEL